MRIRFKSMGRLALSLACVLAAPSFASCSSDDSPRSDNNEADGGTTVKQDGSSGKDGAEADVSIRDAGGDSAVDASVFDVAGDGDKIPEASPDGSETGPMPTGKLQVNGRVAARSDGAMSQAVPLADANIQAAVDRNRDGVIAADERITSKSDDDGKYNVEIAVSKGDVVIVSFTSDGKAAAHRTVTVMGDASVALSVTLAELKQLECSVSGCATPDKQVSITGLPQGLKGKARVFNPVSEADAFPGGFQESTGKMLISGVFASVDLVDATGKAVGKLGSPATLRMTIPPDTWGVIKDVQDGNGQIDVPLYSFDEAKGTWVADGRGFLEDVAGVKIPETQLPSIRNGSFVGSVIARGEVTHFSYWNVDWPVETHGCVTATIVDASGKPVSGAIVTARGLTYNGSSTPQTTGVDGKFCIETMRAEAADEDLNQNGIKGEKHKITLRITYQGKTYDGGEVEIGVSPATCSSGGCTNKGNIGLTPDRELQMILCQFTGNVTDRSGKIPIEGATVVVVDDGVDEDAANALCTQLDAEPCVPMTISDETGAFSVKAVVIDTANVFALQQASDANGSTTRYGETLVRGCPTSNVTVRLDQGFRSVVLQVQVNGNQISWDPDQKMSTLVVETPAGATEATPKWAIVANDTGFSRPVTYGTVPANASVIYPASGRPEPLVPGDQISIAGSYTDQDGVLTSVQGQAFVP